MANAAEYNIHPSAIHNHVGHGAKVSKKQYHAESHERLNDLLAFLLPPV